MYKIIFFELNEVPTRIVNYYMEESPNSWIAKNYARFKKYNTFTENQGHLSPWNTWPTLHRGVASDKHYISDFNQDLSKVDKQYPPIWQLLADKGVKTGVFGSLHSRLMPRDMQKYGFFVPDVFASDHKCFPKNIEVFQKFNLKQSQNSMRNVNTSIDLDDIWDILLNVKKLGITLDSMVEAGRQLVDERINSWKVIRRRTYQTVLSFDIFYKLLESKKPDFITFFTNHVASSMHRYWAASFPDEYEDLKYNSDWINTYKKEILFSMNCTDKMLRKLAMFIEKNRDYKLIVASSMGQGPVACEPVETELYPGKPDDFMKMLGINSPDYYKLLPAMSPQMNLHIVESHIKIFEDNLKGLKVNDELLTYRKKEGGFFSIDFGHGNLEEVHITVKGIHHVFEESGLENIVIQDKSCATAYHIPEGCLFSYHPDNVETKFISGQLPTCDIAPIMLNNYSIKPKPYMNKVAFRAL